MTLTTDPSSFNMIANLGSKRFMRVLGTNSNPREHQQPTRFNSLVHRRKGRLIAASSNDDNINSTSPYLKTPSSQPYSCRKTKFLKTVDSKQPGAFHNTDSSQEKDLKNQNTYEDFERIQKALVQEAEFFISSRPLLNVDRFAEDKVDSLLRDEALDKLRSLHTVIYRLSTEIFCKTSTLLDLFCTRVRVRTKYTALVTAACYYIVSQHINQQDSECIQPTPENLVQYLKCGGSKADLEKMVQIIFLKLKDVQKTVVSTGTHKHFLDAFYNYIVNQHLYNSKYAQNLIPSALSAPSLFYRKLEMALCSSAVNLCRPSCIALALLYTESVQNCHSVYFSIQSSDIYRLANLCNIPRDELKMCTEAILEVLSQTTEFRRQQQRSGLQGLNSSSPPLTYTLSKRGLRAHALLARAHMSGHKLCKITEDPMLEWEQERDFCEEEGQYSNYSLDDHQANASINISNNLDIYCSKLKSGSRDELLCGLLTPMLVA